MEPLWKEGTKACINIPGHMTKVAAKPIYGENLKNHDPETWHAALGNQGLQSLYK